MRPRLLVLIILGVLSCNVSHASKLFIPMDATSQKNHLKAYGVAFAAMQQGIKVDWLLNYKGGSFGMENNNDLLELCKQRGVSCVEMSDKQYGSIIKQISKADFNGKVVQLEKAPKIAVYTPPDKKPWDDAVTMALTYAEIPFDKIYANEVLADDLNKYDWLHLHHEDFTGQFGKFWAQYHDAPWYKAEVSGMQALAQKNGFNKVSHMQLAVVKKIKDFVVKGGSLFAMCSATETFDIALAADGTDICASPFDGDDADPAAQSKLNYGNCIAFQNFVVVTDPFVYGHSSIDNSSARQAHVPIDNSTPLINNDIFTLYQANAKTDPVGAMLTQDHSKIVKGFMGQTTAYKKEVLKPGVSVLGDFAQYNEARYIHGNLGKGSWTFMGGHDPEAYQHMVGDAPTNLSLYPNSPGYRLILNNVLFTAVKLPPHPEVAQNVNLPPSVVNDADRKPLAHNMTDLKDIKVYPNPSNDELLITVSQGNIEQVVIENFAGKQLISQDCKGDKTSISMSSLAPGIYAVKVNGFYAGKVVKE